MKNKLTYKFRIIVKAEYYYKLGLDGMSEIVKEFCEQELGLQNVKVWCQRYGADQKPRETFSLK